MNQTENQHIAELANQITDQLEQRFNNQKVLRHPALVEHNEREFAKELNTLRTLLKEIK